MADPETGQEQGERTWIERQDIKSIQGALKAGAYVARAYNYARDHDGQTPSWARKTSTGQWLFELGYIRADAADNLKYISVSEAARTLGATRRAVQNWVDDGVIPSDRG